MKSRFIRAAVLSALALTSPVLIFAAGQPKLHMLSKSQMQDLSGAAPAVHQGKGAGLSRNSSAAKELPAFEDLSYAARLNHSDTAFRK
jgi:hypothetical protein